MDWKRRQRQQGLNPNAPEFRPWYAAVAPPYPQRPYNYYYYYNNTSSSSSSSSCGVVYQLQDYRPNELQALSPSCPPPPPRGSNGLTTARGGRAVLHFHPNHHHHQHQQHLVTRHQHQQQRRRRPISRPSAPPPVDNQLAGRHQDTTTVMLRNIPNHFTRKMLIHFLDDFCSTENTKHTQNAGGGGDHDAVEFDFVYLPIDFRTKMNKGYAFVNLTTPSAVSRLQQSNIEDQTWGFGDSIRKRREIAVAKIQGKEALIKHFEESRFVCDSEEYLPVSFSPARDGSKMKQQLASHTNIGIRLPLQFNTCASTSRRKKPLGHH